MKAHMDANFIHAIVLSVLGIASVIFGVIPTKGILEEIKFVFIALFFTISVLYGYLPQILQFKLCKITNICIKRLSDLFISLLTCFAGGVLLGTAVLNILYNTKKHFQKFDEALKYPLIELFIGIGLLLMLLIDDLVKNAFNPEPEIKPESIENGLAHIHHALIPIHKLSLSAKVSIESTKTIVSQTPTERKKLKQKQRREKIHLVIVSLAYAIHSFFEGFSFGAQDTALNIVSLFFGIMVHKSIIMFSTGVKLKQKYPNSKIKPGIIIVLMSLITPAGAVLGYILEKIKFNKVVKGTITGILESISIAVFLYVSAFEILATEKENKHSNFVQWLAYALGFALIALILIANAFRCDDHDDDHSGYGSVHQASISHENSYYNLSHGNPKDEICVFGIKDYTTV